LQVRVADAPASASLSAWADSIPILQRIRAGRLLHPAPTTPLSRLRAPTSAEPCRLLFSVAQQFLNSLLSGSGAILLVYFCFLVSLFVSCVTVFSVSASSQLVRHWRIPHGICTAQPSSCFSYLHPAGIITLCCIHAHCELNGRLNCSFCLVCFSYSRFVFTSGWETPCRHLVLSPSFNRAGSVSLNPLGLFSLFFPTTYLPCHIRLFITSSSYMPSIITSEDINRGLAETCWPPSES
jgi:hypothetical protein